jgi:1-acyl-sn-glycerol-3-phosphate acyltransferase
MSRWGSKVPVRRNRALSWLGRTWLRLAGWRTEVALPDLPRFIIIAAPHTSNWDFVHGIATVFAVEVHLHWFAKHTLFRWPFAHLLRWLGGIPINRSAATGVVAQTVAAFEDNPQLIIGLSPEGTRQRVSEWKRGFYKIAVASRVPIVCAFIDYRRKIVGTGPIILPGGNYEADVGRIFDFYRGITARHPHQFTLP